MVISNEVITFLQEVSHQQMLKIFSSTLEVSDLDNNSIFGNHSKIKTKNLGSQDTESSEEEQPLPSRYFNLLQHIVFFKKKSILIFSNHEILTSSLVIVRELTETF